MTNNISQISFNSIQWIDISKKGNEELDFLRKGFSFSDFDIEECENETKHANIFVRKDYIYFEILFPVYNRKTRLIESSEINFFIKGDTIVSVHNNNIPQFTEFFNLAQYDDQLKKNFFQGNPIILLSGILSNLFTSCFPMLNHMDEDILNLEKQIFTSAHRSNTETILRLRWNVVNFTRIIQSYRDIVEKLISNGEHLFSMSKLKIYQTDLIEKTKSIWIMLENQKDSIQALQETNNSLTSFQLNDIMKVLALISAIMMPPAFLTSLFGMNTNMHFIQNNFAFFWILGSCILIIVFFLLYFKKKKWL